MFESMMSWLRPSVVGLIGAAALIMIFNVEWAGIPLLSHVNVEVVSENFPDWKSWVMFGAAIIASLFFKIGPIKIIITGGLLGLMLY